MKSGLSGLADRFFNWSGGLKRAFVVGAAASTLAACEGKTPTPPPVDKTPGAVTASATHVFNSVPDSAIVGEPYSVRGQFTITASQANTSARPQTAADSIQIFVDEIYNNTDKSGSTSWRFDDTPQSAANKSITAKLFFHANGLEGKSASGTFSASQTVDVREPVNTMAIVINVNQYNPFLSDKRAEEDTAVISVRNLRTGQTDTIKGRGVLVYEGIESAVEITPVAVDNQLRWSLWQDAMGACQATDWHNDTPVRLEAGNQNVQMFSFRSMYLNDGPPNNGGDGELAGDVPGTTKGYVPFDVINLTRAVNPVGNTRGRIGIMPEGGQDMDFVTLLGIYTSPIATLSQPFTAEMLSFRDMMLDAHENLQEQALCGNDWGVNRVDVQPGEDPTPYFDASTFGADFPNGADNSIVVYRTANSNNPISISKTDDGQWILLTGTLALGGSPFGDWTSESLLGGMTSGQLNGNAHEGCSVSWSFLGVNDYCNPGSGQPNELDGVYTNGNMHLDDEAASILYYDLVGTFNKAHPGKNFSYVNPDVAPFPNLPGSNSAPGNTSQQSMNDAKPADFYSPVIDDATRRSRLPEDMLRSEDRAQAMGIPLTYATTPLGN